MNSQKIASLVWQRITSGDTPVRKSWEKCWTLHKKSLSVDLPEEEN
jgi:hypothetical protein